MVIGSTGFTSIDLLHVSKVVNLMGMLAVNRSIIMSESLRLC